MPSPSTSRPRLRVRHGAYGGGGAADSHRATFFRTHARSSPSASRSAASGAVAVAGGRTRRGRPQPGRPGHHLHLQLRPVQGQEHHERQPDRACGGEHGGRRAPQEIAGTAQSSMAELRRLLGVLHTGTDTPALTAPQPSLAALGELLGQHRAVDGSAELRVSGEEIPLPASWELSAYRIVQEALTNVRRHAPGAHAVVEVDHRPGLLRVRVGDDGPGPPPATPAAEPAGRPGHGLVGMRERAALLGGRLTTGRGPAGSARPRSAPSRG